MKINEKSLVSDVRSGRLQIDQSLLQVLSNKTIQSLMLAFYTFTDARESPNKRFRLSQDGVEIYVVREMIRNAVSPLETELKRKNVEAVKQRDII